MPLVWSISHPTRFMQVVVRGAVNGPRLTDLLQTIDRAKAGGYRKIIDVRFPGAARTMRALAAAVREDTAEEGPIAIVSRSATARMEGQQIADRAEGSRLIKVFSDGDEARRWLNGFYAFEKDKRLRAAPPASAGAGPGLSVEA